MGVIKKFSKAAISKKTRKIPRGTFLSFPAEIVKKLKKQGKK